MTRFMQEISGSLGTFWKEFAKEELRNLMSEVTVNAEIESDGAIRWKDTGNYIPDDYCEKLEYIGFKFSREATSNKRERQIIQMIAEMNSATKRTK